MDEIYRILDSIQSSIQRDVLATIIHVEGSAYRKEGTSMLFREDGTRVGLLSAGCLEEHISACVQEIQDKGKTETISFDMRSYDDLSWGQGAGCDGIIHVLLEPVDAVMRRHLFTLKSYLEAGKTVMAIKKLTDDLAVSDYLFFAEGEQPFGEWQVAFPNEVKEISQKSGTTFVPELDAFLYTHCFYPKPRLIVFGAGPDAMPLVNMAYQVGFSVTVCDWRPALCHRANFPDADKLIVGFPAEAVKQVQFTDRDFVMILTHQFQRDKELLHILLEKDLCYVGVLGSKTRTIRLLDGKEIPVGVHTPAGLPIGAEGPEEIAVSIVAQLIQLYRKQDIAKVVSA